MTEVRFIAACAVAALLGGPALSLAQSSPEPANPGGPESVAGPRPSDPDAPAANSMDSTGTFSVNPTLQADPGLNAGAKVGPSRTDMNAENEIASSDSSRSSRGDAGAGVSNADSAPQLPVSSQ